MTKIRVVLQKYLSNVRERLRSFRRKNAPYRKQTIDSETEPLFLKPILRKKSS